MSPGVELIAFPDMEAVMVAHLTARLVARGDTVLVATNVPSVRPDRLVKVSRTGGVQRWLVRDAAQMTFECWDVNDVAASSLCRIVRAEVSAMAREDTVQGVIVYSYEELSGPTFFPDPDTRLPRYQFSAALDVRGAALP